MGEVFGEDARSSQGRAEVLPPIAKITNSRFRSEQDGFRFKPPEYSPVYSSADEGTLFRHRIIDGIREPYAELFLTTRLVVRVRRFASQSTHRG